MKPRQILPGATYLVTRRCSQRHLFLRPSRRSRQVFAYCLAYAADRTGVVIHAVIVMSNHYHLVVSDPEGRLPDFVATLNKLVAKCMNALLGRWENFWAGGEATSYVRLLDPDAVLDKTVYALANPVQAGLVACGDQWPGLRLGEPGRFAVERPDVFFREDGPMPESIDLELVAPPLGDGLSADAVWTQVSAAVDAREAALRADAARGGRRFLGAKKVRAQDPYATPTTREPRRALSPRVASKNKWHRIEALGRCKLFLEAYREALKGWRNQLRDVIFPVGTYAMKAWHGARCADA